MTESGADSGMAHFPPGEPAPTAADRAADRTAHLKSPEHLSKLRAKKAEWDALPLEEKRRIRAQREAEKAAKAAAREAKKAAKEAKRNGVRTPRQPDDEVPPTVRSSQPQPSPRGSRSQGRAPAAELDIPRPGASALKGLLDLCAAMPNLGDGTCFIQVIRNKPPMAWNIPTAGVQKPIWLVMDDAEFAAAYGGSEYTLRGYALKEDGRNRALTEPITYKVAGPPNLESALSEDDTMLRPNGAPNGHGHPVPHPGLRRPGLVTPQAAAAEAQIHDRTLTHRERSDERQDLRRAQERREREEREERRREQDISIAKMLEEKQERELERADRAHQRELELVQSQQPKGSNMAELAEALKILKPGGDAEKHAAEIRQITESHKAEILRLTENHQQEVRRLTDQHTQALHRVEDQARQDRERIEKLGKEAEQRAADQVREAERRADQRVTDTQNQWRTNYEELRSRSEERIRDQNDQWQRRLDDQRANHDREVRQKESEINMMRSNLEGNQAVILQAKDNEIKRLQHDLREAKAEAERNKDWMGRMEEFHKTAEMLGYDKGGGGGEGEEEDVKTIALKAGLGALQRLPEMITAGVDGITKLRNPGVPTDLSRGQSRSGMVRESMRTAPHGMMPMGAPQIAPLTFATEEGGYQPPPDLSPPRIMPPAPVMAPQPLPPLQPPQQAAPPQPLQPLQPSATDAPPVAPPPQQEPQLPPPQQAVPEPQPTPSAPPPQPQAIVQQQVTPPVEAPAVEGLDPMAVTIIHQFVPQLAQQFQDKLAPADVAAQIVGANTPDLVRMALDAVSIEQLLQYLRLNPGPYGILVTRNGERFLRDTWRATEQAVAQ